MNMNASPSTSTTSTVVDDPPPPVREGDAAGAGGPRDEPSPNDLTLLTGALLLTADVVGTGVLALPADVRTLGTGWGLGFLLLNLPANLYAGTVLGRCARFVEGTTTAAGGDGRGRGADGDASTGPAGGKRRRGGYRGVGGTSRATRDGGEDVEGDGGQRSSGPDDGATTKTASGGRRKGRYSGVDAEGAATNGGDEDARNPTDEREEERRRRRADAATCDFVGMASMLFDAPVPGDATAAFDPDRIMNEDEGGEPHLHRRQVTYDHPFTRAVLFVYYINLVMSHAVAAMVGEDNLCMPTAGLIASTLMFAVSQLRTMANLGRGVSAASLAALLIVIAQCLYALRGARDDGAASAIAEEEREQLSTHTPGEVALAKMGSVAAICFAVGSQKLLLNIRHEMANRDDAAPGALSVSLATFGAAYVAVCVAAGPDPPSFLFDAIPEGLGRRIGGLLLWGHVAVSYAINSQAFCSSVDRMVGHRVKLFGLEERHRLRWAILTAFVALLSYLIANGIPFFKDLVALCGAATTIPLTLLIPAIFYRRVQGVPLLFPTLHSKYSFALVLYSVVFMLVGLIGAIGSIDVDWTNKSDPFGCH